MITFRDQKKSAEIQHRIRCAWSALAQKNSQKEHERLIRSTQRRMLRLIIQIKEEIQKKKVIQEDDIKDNERSEQECDSGEEGITRDG